MVRFENTTGIICCKTVVIKDIPFAHYKKKCTALATHTNGSHHFCRHHSKMQRFVAREGDTGKILARFETEQELRNNIHLFPEAEMQKLTKSHRKTLNYE